ncbi:MAG: hypothetical protein M3401_09965 [Actinomycetota bacterium]|nr:hypothetical protein [Actinomycetota bacterium]
MRLADAFRDPVVRPQVDDHDFLLRCSCGTEQRLNVMTICEWDDITLYDCAVCENSIVGVMTSDPMTELLAPAPMTRRQEPGGHRLNGYLIGSKVDVVLRSPGSAEDEVLIPATPNFFVQYRHL